MTVRDGLIRTLTRFVNEPGPLRELRIPPETARALLDHLRGAPNPLEDALIALSNAVDSKGIPIMLYRPPRCTPEGVSITQTHTVDSLREATFLHLQLVDPQAQYVTLTPLVIDSTDAQESAYWRNLALLANALALAISHETTP